MKVTLAHYYRSFGSLYALGAGIPFLPPLLHQIVEGSDKSSAYFYPPLGGVERLAFAATIIFLVLSTLVIFICCRLARRIHPSVPVLLMLGAGVGVCALIVLDVMYVTRTMHRAIWQPLRILF
jgi:hypothetical protein